jgi:hypothetical protein
MSVAVLVHCPLTPSVPLMRISSPISQGFRQSAFALKLKAPAISVTGNGFVVVGLCALGFLVVASEEAV